MVMLILLMGFVVYVLGFNNKMQICFGYTSVRSSNQTITVTLPLSFANSSYTCVEGNAGTSTNQQESGTVTSKSTSSFKVFAWSARATNWIALGRGN